MFARRLRKLVGARARKPEYDATYYLANNEEKGGGVLSVEKTGRVGKGDETRQEVSRHPRYVISHAEGVSVRALSKQ